MDLIFISGDEIKLKKYFFVSLFLMLAGQWNCESLTNSHQIDEPRILFRSRAEFNHEIYSAYISGRELTNLTNNPFIDDEPVISPDGNLIAFISNRDSSVHIFLMNSDGTNQVRISPNSHYDLNPIFSPLGNEIAYISKNSITEPSEIIVMDLTSKTKLSITDIPELAEYSNFYSYKYSNNGSMMALVAGRGSSQRDIVILDQHYSVQNIITNGFKNYSASFAPSDSNIVFASNIDGDDEIFIYNLYSGSLRQITDNEVRDSSPLYNKTGGMVVFLSFQGEYIWQSIILSYDIKTSELYQLTEQSKQNYLSQFSTDGRYMIYSSDGEIHLYDFINDEIINFSQNSLSGFYPSFFP